jgi:cell division control protein CDC15
LDPFLKKIYNINNINFKIGEILFEGQTSVIYKVLNLQSGKFFVIKRYYDFKYYDLYINEIEIYKKINYKRIIKYFGNYCNKNENEFFIYLKFAENGNLKNLIDLNGPLKENLIQKFLIQILKILNYLHNKLKIAHRDIKSSNFLLGPKNELFLSDFGCSEKINETNENLYGLKGTLPFCAPEILAGKKYSTKCDIWSLGCTIIEMGGMSPWQGKKLDNYYQCITVIVKSDDVPEIPNYFCDDLKDFVSKCFQRDVEKRFDVGMLLKHKFVGCEEIEK